MPLPLPNLDDRTFADLSGNLRSLIPRYDKTWTNHNPSDPGITLIELCSWLAEMLIYRMNRIEKRNYLTFLDLVGVRPSGPQTVMTFTINIGKNNLPASFVLPRGTRVAARNEQSEEEIIFETTMDVLYDEDNWDEGLNAWVFKVPAVNTLVIEKELLGVGTGSPGQEFSLKQGPLFLDREQESYDGNPKVTVEASGVSEPWTYKADLLSSGPDEMHFTADPLTGLIRFGNSTNGKIPPPGSKLQCTYRRLGGTAGNVAAGKITMLVDPLGGISMSSVSVSNEYAATGGTDGETLDDLLARGLRLLQDPYRAVSEEDFEYLTRQAASDKVARVKVAANRNLEGTTPIEEGHMSVIILPVLKELGLPEQPAVYIAATKTFVLNRTSDAMRNGLAGGKVKKLSREIYRYLDERRLITTILHVTKPAFTSVRLKITLQAKPGVKTDALMETVGKGTATFLDPYKGWEDGTGWLYGRNVYRAELYQLIESIEGVDYVTSLKMNDDETTSLIAVGENRLVCLDELAVEVSS